MHTVKRIQLTWEIELRGTYRRQARAKQQGGQQGGGEGGASSEGGEQRVRCRCTSTGVEQQGRGEAGEGRGGTLSVGGITQQSPPLRGRPNHSEGGRTTQREAEPLRGGPNHSEGGRTTQRGAEPLRGRPNHSEGGRTLPAVPQIRPNLSICLCSIHIPVFPSSLALNPVPSLPLALSYFPASPPLPLSVPPSPGPVPPMP